MRLIAALDKDHAIGKDNKIPWHIPQDLSLFKKHTLNETVVMGRKTYESILSYLNKPLPKRNNIVVSSTLEETNGIRVARSLSEALEISQKEFGQRPFIIGGQNLYEQALPLAVEMYLSHIKKSYGGDTFFPKFDCAEWRAIYTEDFGEFVFKQYVRVNH